MTVRILQGDCLDVLPKLPDESVHCVVTSPPYWGLRNYGVDKAIGLEPTLDEYIDKLVRVFREVRRVLRSDGTCWLNLGDAYANDGKWGGETGGKQAYLDDTNRRHVGRHKRKTGLKPKDLLMLPARIALALQEDGWWLRSEIVWNKLNCTPESVQDRPTSAHEKVFLLSKSACYFYDAYAVRTPPKPWHGSEFRPRAPERKEPDPDIRYARQRGHLSPEKRKTRVPTGWDTGPGAHGTIHRNGRTPRSDKQRGHSRRHAGFNDRWDLMSKVAQQGMGANLRNVWPMASEPFPGSHYATMPTALVEPCIKAGSSAEGACSQCGAPWVRITDKYATGRTAQEGVVHQTVGWKPTCDHEAEPVPCTVLDPFGGSGTTGLVADRLGRDAILIELNPKYVEMAQRRIVEDAPLFAAVTMSSTPAKG